MKINKWLSLTSVSAVMAVLVFCSNKQLNGNEPLLIRLTDVMSTEHYSPYKLNDQFSEMVFNNVLKNLDDDKHFFTQGDIDKLSVFKKSIDDQLKVGRYDFLDSAWSILMVRLNTIEPMIDKELSKPLNYKLNKNYVVSEKVLKYQPNLEALEQDWKNWLQYQTIDRLYRKIEDQENVKQKKDSAVIKILPFDTLELKARNETLKFCKDWFKRWRKMDQKDKLSLYANCITEVYDPHSNYFPPEDKANFDISMTGKLEGIGATLSEKDGYVKVERIVPGSASARQGELKAGDLILKVAQGAADAVDIVDMKLDDAIQLIRGKKGTEVRLTVKKPDGTIQVIPIIREVVVIEESYARSAIVSFKGKRFGLIQLPSFYADFAAQGRGRHSSEDIRIELEKLKMEKVDGIVLDLRNNGGGSLADAIDMSGLFIEEGPIVQVKDPNQRIQQAPDPDPEIQYSGPLVVLTNTYSASASEILAAALQDYQRAVIVGTNTTFGKGTVQTMMPLPSGKSPIFPKGYGEVKVTIQKFYRINGGTTQLHGVVPDVILPDIYDGIEQGEKEMDYHMPYDKIPAAEYKLFNNKNRADIVKSSIMRTQKNEYYKLISKRATELAKMRNSFSYCLNLDGYKSQQKQIKEQDKYFRDYKYKRVIDTAFALPIDLDEVKNDELKKAQKLDWIKRYMKDAGLDESIQILYDWSERK
jgi:carboxyl-terminal processing protease